MPDTQMESQRIVILGGTSGIGLATAERAAADGASVIVASSSAERVDAALERLPASAEGYTVNVRDPEEIRDLFSRLGSFDHLAFTAGETLQIGAIADTDLEAARRALDVRLWGAYAAVKDAVAHLRPGGSIVLSSGIAGTRPERNWTVAAAVCGALDALTRALAVELAPIRVNAVVPGVVRSELWREMSEEDRSAMYDSVSEALPVGRVGEVSDIAETFLYLMRNGYSSGTLVTVDGGSVLV
ncbi:MAG TPA: SDR family oxidoreductase [Solirubrobacteraceae bacterium]|jgi:NAD(P)-dependent dehydrogenase (short-subunit alcohol dehydrogenase family)